MTFVLGAIPIRKNSRQILCILGVLFAIEAALYYLFDLEFLLNTYPLHTHLILILYLYFYYKIHFFNATMYVILAYMSCQIPAWLSKFSVYVFSGSALAELIGYFIIVVVTAVVIMSTVGDSVEGLLGRNPKTNIAFGLIPVTYYIFDYATSFWTDLLYSGNYHITQFMPSVLCVGYLVFTVAYRKEQKQRQQVYEEKILIERNMDMLETEIENIREIEKMSRIYRHDMRHHLQLLLNLIQKNKLQQAENYILENIQAVTEITPERYCDIDVLNMLLAHYGKIAEREHITYHFDVKLSEMLQMSNMEICAMVSNALENACHANACIPEEKRELELVFKEHNGMLIFSVDNACEEQLEMDEIDPATDWYKEHGFGTKSIEAIAKKYNGSVKFSAKNGTFRTMVVIQNS